ncbi:MAG: serine hydrolase [bacterium]
MNDLRKLAMIIFVFLVAATTLYSQSSAANIDSLIAILTNKNEAEAIRLIAAEIFGAIKTQDTNAIKSLIACFSDENLYLRGKAASSLGQISKPAVPYLIKSLQDENENIRWLSAIALSKMKRDASEAAPYLAEALTDKNESVRWCSLIALGKIGKVAYSFTQQISKFLYDDDEDIKWAAVYALRKINGGKISQPPTLDYVSNAIDNIMPGLMKEFKIPGVSVCLVKDRKIAWSKSYGVKDTRTNELVTNETMFEACSMTKPMFAYSVLKLIEENKLDLDKPLTDYLDEKFISIVEYKNEITARMILCHTSGLPNWRKGDEETEGPLPIYFEPGTKYSYSGEGFYYLQRVIEKITGEPIDVYARKKLFKPLGLKHISYSWTQEFDSFISAGHDTSGNFLQKTKYTQPNAAYSLYTSAEDYATFICRILDPGDSHNSYLSQNSISQMINHQVEVNVREPISRPGNTLGINVYWGLGWAIDSTVSGDIVYHSGANRSGFRCYSQFNYDRGTAIVIMTNGLNGSDFWRSIIRKIGDF